MTKKRYTALLISSLNWLRRRSLHIAALVRRFSHGVTLQRTARFLEQLAKFSVVIALIQYFYEAPDRQRQQQLAMWQVINAARGSTGDAGRIIALSSLNRAGANLENADLSWATLDRVDLRGADLIDANLRHARLTDANLCAANLDGADLTGAHIIGADLRWATLAGAILDSSLVADAQANHADFTLAKMRNAQFYPRGHDTLIVDQLDLRGTWQRDRVQPNDSLILRGRPIFDGEVSLLNYVSPNSRGAPMRTFALDIIYARRRAAAWAAYPGLGFILKRVPWLYHRAAQSAQNPMLKGMIDTCAIY